MSRAALLLASAALFAAATAASAQQAGPEEEPLAAQPLEIRGATRPAASDRPAPAPEDPAGDLAAPTSTAGPPAPGETPGDDDASADPGELFVRANAAYEAGRHAEAAELYRRLLDLGVEDGRLYYNLGNAYLRNGELGRAIAAYRQGRLLRPRDEDLRANLAFARQSTLDAIAAPEPPALLATLFFWHYGLSPGELAAAALLANALFWGAWTVRLFRGDSETLRWLFLLLLVLLVATAGSLAARRLLPQRVAVVVPQQVAARTAPDPGSVVRFQLHAGTELRVKDEREGWLRIALPDGQQGWIRRDQAALVGG